MEEIASMEGTPSYEDLLSALKDSGIARGDTVFCHIHLEGLGDQKAARADSNHQRLLQCLQESVGEQGTILIPTYTFSFCNNEVFDINNTPAKSGPWSTSVEFLEFFRRQPGVVRSRDPIHSVAGLGQNAHMLLADLPNTCFGNGSIHDRLKNIGGKICVIGSGLQEVTFAHHIEEKVGVPYRFKKLFSGYIRASSQLRKLGWIYNVRILSNNADWDGHRLDKLCRSSGRCKSSSLGLGEIVTIAAADLAEVLTAAFVTDSWFTARGPAGDAYALEEARVAAPAHAIDLAKNASMSDMIQALWRLPRDIVSQGYDDALKALANIVPMLVHRYPSGTECWSWIIPEKWKCKTAYLETLDGRQVFSYTSNPLHAVSYSLSFEGEVSRKELFEHLHVHHKIPEAIPFIFKYYERDWGLCCSKKLKETLIDDRYKVVIKSDFSFGALKVGEVVVPGKSEQSIMLCAHLCHPAMVNDDLAGVVVGIKIMQELLARQNLHYTYRLLLVPETIGSVAYLSKNECLIPKMKGGLFLEMLGLENPHALQHSFAGSTDVDLCFAMALKDGDPDGWTGTYRSIIGNDERQFNAPGARVPMLSLSRVLPPSAPDWPYREYHSSHDTPEVTSTKRLEQSVALVLQMIDTLEGNEIPINKFKGEVFCSRYGLFIDPYENPEGSSSLFNIMDSIDGTRSIAEIARACAISFRAARSAISELHRHDLVEYRSR